MRSAKRGHSSTIRRTSRSRNSALMGSSKCGSETTSRASNRKFPLGPFEKTIHGLRNQKAQDGARSSLRTLILCQNGFDADQFFPVSGRRLSSKFPASVARRGPAFCPRARIRRFHSGKQCPQSFRFRKGTGSLFCHPAGSAPPFSAAARGAGIDRSIRNPAGNRSDPPLCDYSVGRK